MKIPLPEMEADLVATQRDIKCLVAIVDNLEIFIQQSHGEDRSSFKVDLLKYSTLLSQAHNLEQRIKVELEKELDAEVQEYYNQNFN